MTKADDVMTKEISVEVKPPQPQPEQEEKETGGLFRKKEDREDKSDDEGAGEHGAGKEA
ncbi:MAG: hypothetical protein L6V89_09960 [Oscillospiraceae bacterium]|nr:MAG: hypothetical protein L6V89_09960 [Oscillospiraceae bacterium]